MPGLHPLLVRLAGFDAFTVPALELDGEKVQGSRPIARFLDELRPERALFPAEPERWGEQALQPVPRRLFRHLMLTSERARVWMAADVLRMPAPRVMGALFVPVIRRLAETRTPTTRACARTSGGCQGCSTRWTG